MAQWYLSLYTVKGGLFTLDNYERCDSLEQAQQKARYKKPYYNTQRYIVECTVGSRCTKAPKQSIPKREPDKFSKNKTKATFQKDANDKINKLVRRIRALSPNAKLETIQSVTNDIEIYKTVWTKEQYAFLLQELMNQPCCVKLLHEYHTKHSTGYYI